MAMTLMAVAVAIARVVARFVVARGGGTAVRPRLMGSGNLKVLLSTIAIAACGGSSDSKPDAGIGEGLREPDVYCPGGPKCKAVGDGVLKVGAAARAYTP